MIKAFTITILLAFIGNTAFSQIGGTNQLRDSLKHALVIAKNDTSRVLIMADLANAYWITNLDSSFAYGNQALMLAKRIRFSRGEASALNALGLSFQVQGDCPGSLEILNRSLQISEQNNYVFESAVSYSFIGGVYWFLGDFPKALSFIKRSQDLFATIISQQGVGKWILYNKLFIGQAYLEYQLDSAHVYLSHYYDATMYDTFWHPVALYSLGDCLFRQRDHVTSLNYVRESIPEAAANEDYFTEAEACAVMSKIFMTMHQPDSAIYYAKKGLAAATSIRYDFGIYRHSKLLADEYEHSNANEALLYRKVYDSINEEMYGEKKVQELQKTLAEEQQRQQQIQEEQIKKEDRLKQYGFITGLAIMLLIAFILYRNNLQKKKANVLLQHQKEKVETTLGELNIANEQLENKNRDLEIEAALEKVRSRSLAMHKSEELREVIQLVFEQLRQLKFNIDAAFFDPRYRESDDLSLWVGRPGQPYAEELFVPYTDLAVLNAIKQAKKEGLNFLANNFTFEEKNEFFSHFFTHVKNVPEERQAMIFKSPGFAWSIVFMDSICLSVQNYLGIPYSETENAIIHRFAKVFEQAYIRFLDLQKAEAQAREAQVEAALERVRAKAMAMHNSEDLNETIKVFYQQISLLSFRPRRCGVGLVNKENRTGEISVINTTEQGDSIETIGKVDLTGHPVKEAVYDHWLSQQDYFPVLKGNQIKEYYEAFGPQVNFPDPPNDAVQFGYFFFFNEGALYTWTTQELPEEELKIYRRFNSVLSLTYKRYKDLQKAEAQAREAQVEAALERVRFHAMAMQNSEDIANATSIMFSELKALGIETIRGGILIIYKSQTMEVWTAATSKEGKEIKIIGNLDMTFHPIGLGIYKAWEQGDEIFFHKLPANDADGFYSAMAKQPDYTTYTQYASLPEHYCYVYNFKEGGIYVFSLNPHSDETKSVFKKFANVFALTYRRYVDLKKAEFQAREATIEAALERVRAKTMAMHKSEELPETAALVFNQLAGLGVNPYRSYIVTIPDISGEMEFWLTDEEGKKIAARHIADSNKNLSLRKMYEGWARKDKSMVIDMVGREVDDFVNYGRDTFHVEFKPGAALKHRIQNIAYFSKGFIAITTLELQPESTLNLLERFAAVFNLTYTRFRDLQQAEAQAREATIEAALEKVRGKAMAMHNSEDLLSTAAMVFTEINKLGINPYRCGVGIVDRESLKCDIYTSSISIKEGSLSLVGWTLLSGHPVFAQCYESWIRKEDYLPVLSGEEIKSYYEHITVGLSVPYIPDWQSGKKQYGCFLPFSIGILYAWSEDPFSESELKILRRFTSVLDLTFRRYSELQQSEASAREAVKRAALDRIRADIASMRKIGDLDRITPLIWNELKILGVPFIRCGVFIMDDSNQTIHTFLSTPEGKAITAFHLHYSTPGKISVMLNHWQHKKIYIDQWTSTDFNALAEALVNQREIKTKEEYLNTLPHQGFYLHVLPFLQGMLYVANMEKLNEEQIELIQSVADAFSTAYARYEDFNKLEAAKQQIEKTFTELKQAQTQLIQSEKMASLGELTAGIAHEIQNPLNFVNNFSEVNNELISELVDEVDKGNYDEVKVIAVSLKDNEEKINHHGKRADAIVKGMLQHSRSTSGQRELTDINKLADEYLRLSYHGMRAKDKSFNAEYRTDFDEGIGKINVVPQDIGRVLLNLYNNAFYAVNEKKKTYELSAMSYAPLVTVQTKKLNDKIEIIVGDNGNGIPQNIVDKIFQPFFTTKPTGQGTGLGLSLAYDIIKAHGGEIKVETKKGEETMFIIQLPNN
jgi:signal transduction histidine kinase